MKATTAWGAEATQSDLLGPIGGFWALKKLVSACSGCDGLYGCEPGYTGQLVYTYSTVDHETHHAFL